MTRKTRKRLRNIILVVIVVVFAGSLVIPATTRTHGSDQVVTMEASAAPQAATIGR